MKQSRFVVRLVGARHMTFIFPLFVLMFHTVPEILAPAHAQGTRKDDIVFNSRGVPLAGATVRVCTQPASQPPCTPLALIYSDPALTQALANPTTTDGLGNYHFYAAPGKYTIEVSGPSITTKQIPDVIIPQDPTNANFTGNISAFSLSLSGNLTVNGNTSVVGNLASGTLTMNNQGTAPGAAPSGTVNLYTKSADKRLYYKDDTGAETGPLLPGAATNVSNTFTAPQNIDADFHTKGPNPYYDLTRAGGYLVNAIQTTTGSTISGTKNLTLGSAIDFQNGQGILVIGAGPATALATPTGLAVTPSGVTGSTTYTYCVVAEDYAGGRTACSAAASTTTGSATFGAATIGGGLTSCNRTSGTATCTTASAHNLSIGSFVNILRGSTTDASFETTATVLTVPTSTTFTFGQVGAPDISGSLTSGTLQVLARNLLQWNIVPYSVLRSYIYRCTTTCAFPANAANFALAGVASGMDSSFYDQGFAVSTASIGNADVSATAPTSASNQYLLSTVTAGGGTTALTLNDAAAATVSGAITVHDNGITIKKLCATMAGGGTLFVPNSAASFPVNSTLNLFTACPGGIDLQLGANLVINGTIIPRSMSTIRGIAGQNEQGGNFYSLQAYSQVSGHGYPFFYMLPGTTHDFSMENMVMLCNQAYQPCVVQDQDAGGGGVTSIRYRNVHLAANSFSSPYIMGGGFGYFWEYGGWDVNASSFASPPAVLDKVSCGFGTSQQQLAGIFYSDKTYNFGGIVYDACNQPSITAPGHTDLKEMLVESAYGPSIRTANYANNVVAGFTISYGTYADFLGGASVPFFDLSSAGIDGFDVYFTSCGNGAQPLFQTNPARAYSNVTVRNSGFNNGCSNIGIPNVVANQTSFAGVPVIASGNSSVLYSLTAPAVPSLSNTAGTLASGTYLYRIVPNDANGTPGPPSLVSAACSSNGSQACVLNWTLVPGQASTTICRGVSANGIACATPGPAFQVSGTSFTDNQPQFAYSASLLAGTGGSSVLGPNGLATQTLKLTGGGNVATVSGTFGASRTQTIPDVTGVVPVTSYLNSAYDNANRANGAIGSNWTVANNGINISANNFIGTAGNNDVASWSASTFGNPQFSQATITALNGTTDFPGVAVFLSGSGANTHGYNCIEDTTNIFIQRISGTSNTTVASAATTGAVGDILRLEADAAGNLTCFKNGAVALAASDSTYLTGTPGLFLFGTVATEKNWSGGNLHPLNQMDVEADYTKVQHLNAGIGMGLETFTASPRAEQNVFFPGALTSTWTGATWTLDKAVTITRVQAQAKTAPTGCTTNAVVRLSDGTSPLNVTLSAAANDSGPITQNYAAGASLTLAVQTAAAGCTTSPADINVIVQYRMQ